MVEGLSLLLCRSSSGTGFMDGPGSCNCRDAKTLQNYKPGLEEGFGQKLRKVLLSKIKFYIVGIVLTSVENKSSINA